MTEENNVTELSNEAWTAQYVVGQVALERANYQDIVVVVRFKDGKLGTISSKMDVSTLSLLAARLNLRVMDTLGGGRE